MGWLDSIALLGLGLLSGILAGFFGIGGGTLIVPAMLLLGLDIKAAIGISVMQMAFSSLWGSYMNYKKGNLNFNEGLWVGIGGLIGAAFSGILVDNLSSIVLEIAFLCITIAALWRFTCKANDSALTPRENPNKFILIAIGMLTGIFAISLGIGGGLILVPLLSLYLRTNSKHVIPISLFFIIFASVSGFASLAYHGYVDYAQGATVGVASIIGVSLGISLLRIIDAKKHRYALVVLYVLVILTLVWELFKTLAHA